MGEAAEAGVVTEGERVFVYGTLRRGASNAWRMAGGEWLGAATVRGMLYRVSWYPALVLDATAGEVAGELWRVSAELLRALDRFEGVSAQEAGAEYRRVRAWVRVDDGREEAVWLWEWAAGVAGLAVVAGGDWLAFIRGAAGYRRGSRRF
jgi:gamma-glutamylcyclotransferase (GGCT)/AIG2-like uncharacterized protein YtfP